MPTVSSTHASSWGTATLGGHRVNVRTLVFWGGIAFWIGNLILHTGTNGIGALWTSLLFVAEVAIIASATRTITLQRVVVLYCLGGAMMGVGWLISVTWHTLMPDPDAVSTQFFIPMVEELVKLAPVVFIAWRQRKTRLWTMGASDFLLMGAASGAGFGLVEEAHIRILLGTPLPLAWFPISRINGVTLTVGHGMWTALAAATVGLALLWRPRRPIVYLLGASGVLWTWFDHSHHNYGVRRTGTSVDLFNFVTAHGWLSLYFLLIALVVALASDLNVIYRALPRIPELKTPFAGFFASIQNAMSAWKFLLTKRAIAFVAFHYKKEPPSVQSGQLEPILYSLLETLFELRQTRTPSVPGPSETAPEVIKSV